MSVSGNVQIKAGRQKCVAVSKVLRLAKKVFQKPCATGERGESERQVALRAFAREVDGDEPKVFARSPKARHEILLALVAVPSLARLDLPPLTLLQDRVRRRRRARPAVLLG